MPQLDALTYFSQYIYLLISFVAVYIFVLNFIMPKVVSTLKLRQKLNSLNLLSNKLNQPSLQVYERSKLQTLFTHYDQLLNHNWKTNTTKQKNDMLQSVRAMQFCMTFRLKKLFCDNVVRKIN
jgi:ABC-type uncharacterized transport system YnjBCD substrate-binding protein